jgi:translation initiation factor 1 (eIF-1/SUI1)
MTEKKGRKPITHLYGLSDEQANLITRGIKIKYKCNGAVLDGNVVCIQGDLRQALKTHIIETFNIPEDKIFIHNQ